MKYGFFILLINDQTQTPIKNAAAFPSQFLTLSNLQYKHLIGFSLAN